MSQCNVLWTTLGPGIGMFTWHTWLHLTTPSPSWQQNAPVSVPPAVGQCTLTHHKNYLTKSSRPSLPIPQIPIRLSICVTCQNKSKVHGVPTPQPKGHHCPGARQHRTPPKVLCSFLYGSESSIRIQGGASVEWTSQSTNNLTFNIWNLVFGGKKLTEVKNNQCWSILYSPVMMMTDDTLLFRSCWSCRNKPQFSSFSKKIKIMWSI